MKKGKKRILFLTFNDLKESHYGGAQCSIRNYQILAEYGEVRLFTIKKISNLSSLKSILQLNFPPFLNKHKEEVKSLLMRETFDLIFCDNTLLGNLLEDIKSYTHIPIISFAHNVELDYINVRFKNKRRGFLYKILAKNSESKTIKHSKVFLTLNERDSLRFKKLYNRKADEILPITFENKLSRNKIENIYKEVRGNVERTCIFVGAYAKSNYEGIKWFVEKVAPYIDVKIKIIGKGFENYKEELQRYNVEVLGFVKNLESEYINADFVIAPILFGGGMKVKIAEALMYGKTIYGTKEAFEGYEMNYNFVGGLCNTAEEFIASINNSEMEKFNAYSRNIFEKKYNSETLRFKINEILGGIDKDIKIGDKVM